MKGPCKGVERAVHRPRPVPPVPERTCVSAEAVIYPEGFHVCNNIPFLWRPLAADWLAEKLDS